MRDKAKAPKAAKVAKPAKAKAPKAAKLAKPAKAKAPKAAATKLAEQSAPAEATKPAATQAAEPLARPGTAKQSENGKTHATGAPAAAQADPAPGETLPPGQVKP
jgi:DNA-binding protein HU-beta